MLRTGLSLTVWTLAGVATVLAASGQIEFARWAGITDVRAYAVPAVLELVAVAFLLIGYRRARRGDSAGTLWFLAALVGAFAVYTNVAHTGGRAGLVFGAASAVTLVLWFVKLRDDYRQHQRHSGQATRPRPKLGALWLVAPRLSVRAWVIATRRRISTVDEAVGYAEVWRAVYEDARSARVGRRLARRTAWRTVAEVAGGTVAELPRTAEIAAVQVLQRSAGSGVDGPSSGSAPSISPPAPAASLPPSPASVPPPTSAAPVSPATVSPATVAPATVAPATAASDLRDRVFARLNEYASTDQGIDESDEPYLVWSVAGALGETSETVAPHVRSWLQMVRAGQPSRSPAPVVASLMPGLAPSLTSGSATSLAAGSVMR